MNVGWTFIDLIMKYGVLSWWIELGTHCDRAYEKRIDEEDSLTS